MTRSPLLVALLAIACSPPAPPAGDFAAQDGGLDVQGEASADASDGAGGSIVPDGTWLLWAETASCVKLGNGGIETVNESLMKIELASPEPGVLAQKLENCLIQQSPVLGVTTTFPAKLVASIPTRTFYALLDAPSAGSVYQSQLDVEVWGAKLADPLHDELPLAADDPRVYDMDGDGKPGATVLVGASCQMQIVERSFARWNGVVVDGTEIAGGGESSYQQNVLAASSGFCASNPAPWFPKDANRFVLLRVDGQHGAADVDQNHDGSVSCDEIAAHGVTPFGPRAPDNSHCDQSGSTP